MHACAQAHQIAHTKYVQLIPYIVYFNEAEKNWTEDAVFKPNSIHD